jgi:hypothetical protein
MSDRIQTVRALEEVIGKIPPPIKLKVPGLMRKGLEKDYESNLY